MKIVRLLLINSFIFASSFASHVLLKPDFAQPQTIPDASYFDMHSEKDCGCNSPNHKAVLNRVPKTNNRIAITFYDRSGWPLCSFDITNEQEPNSFNRSWSSGWASSWAEKKIDPDAGLPRIHKVTIANCVKRGRAISFYGPQGKLFYTRRYDGSASFNEEDKLELLQSHGFGKYPEKINSLIAFDLDLHRTILHDLDLSCIQIIENNYKPTSKL